MCFRIKTTNKSIQSMPIACSPFWVTIEPLATMNTRRNPLCWQSFHFKNDKRRNDTSISTNAFQYQNPLLMPRLCLKLLMDICIDNTIIHLLASFSLIANPLSSMLYTFSSLILNSAYTFSKSSNHCFNHSGKVSLTRTASIDPGQTLASSGCHYRKCWTHCSLILSYTCTCTPPSSVVLIYCSLRISTSRHSVS